jgi:hypothetical protein
MLMTELRSIAIASDNVASQGNNTISNGASSSNGVMSNGESAMRNDEKINPSTEKCGKNKAGNDDIYIIPRSFENKNFKSDERLLRTNSILDLV